MAFAKAMGVTNERTDEPILGGGIILNEGPIGHISVIVEINERGFLVIESNYISCTKGYRFLAYDYNRIRYFVK